MSRLLSLAAVIEAATGVALMVDPSVVAQLLLGTEISGAAVAVGRVAGIGLLALGLAYWPSTDVSRVPHPRRALLTYNLLTTLYLAYLGFRGEWVGRFLWPAVMVHAVLTVFLARAWFQARKAADPR